MDKKEDFYKRLREKLIETTAFPSKYMYKFIIDSNPEKIKQVEDLFNHSGAVIDTRKSKSGKYTSVSIVVKMNDADQIIKTYKKAEKIEGIISL